jgi:hypothetical protein
MVFIYVLQLKENKWYIGKTETSKFRIDTHFDSAGSEFTKKYPPQEIYQIIPECDKYDEDKYVKKYMDKYGIDNVRGGTYCRLELTSNEKEVIQKELCGANDLCFLCGGDHFVKDCPNNKQLEELEEELNEEELLKTIKKRITSNVSGGFETIYFADVKGRSKRGPWTIESNRDGNKTHFDEYFSFDNYTISEYINNDKIIMDLYKQYVVIIIKYLKETKNIYSINEKFYLSNDKIKLKQIFNNIEDRIKNIIKNLGYLEMNKIINNKYHKNYVLTNFNLNIVFEKKFSEHIYINYFIEDCLNNNRHDCYINEVLCKKDYLLFSKTVKHNRPFTEIANIHITGELYYDT